MELNFKEYMEAWGPWASGAAGAYAGGTLAGPLGAVAGGLAGYYGNKWLYPQQNQTPGSNQGQPFQSIQPYHYYKDASGKIQRIVACYVDPNHPLSDEEYTRLNQDPQHPCIYIPKIVTNKEGQQVRVWKGRQKNPYGQYGQERPGQEEEQPGYGQYRPRRRRRRI